MLSETRGWPLVARGAYHELLGAQWDLGILPRDPSRLRSLIGATMKEWHIVWPFIASKFPIVPAGRQNPTLETRRRKSLDLQERRHAASLRAHAARWGDRRAATESDDA
jgi:hypothetical protein